MAAAAPCLGWQGNVLVPESVAELYSRPDITYVPVTDVGLDQVLLAWDVSRRSPLITAFAEAARRPD
jgi:hypothetical protein